MLTLNLVQGDLTPIIVLTPSGVDLTGKEVVFLMNLARSDQAIELVALPQPGGDVHVGLTEEATAVPGMYYGQLAIKGEQTAFERVLINVRQRFA